MKKWILFTLLMVSLSILSYSQESFLRIRDMDNEGLFINGQPAIINMLILAGDTIKTDKSTKAELIFNEQNMLRIDKNTTLEICTINSDALQIILIKGRIFLRKQDKSLADIYLGKELLANGWIRITNQCKCCVFDDENKTEIKVQNGNALFNVGSFQYADLRKNDVLTAHTGEKIQVKHLSFFARIFDGMFDNFYGYNSRREQVLNDSDLSFLAKYGTWRTWHGRNAWVPDKLVLDNFFPDWYPYLFGRWHNYHRGGYGLTWISYEPWGWLTYHYGNWIYIPDWGWCWVLDETWTWRPSWVFWFSDENYLGWYPQWPDWYGSWYYEYYQKPGPHGSIKQPITIIKKDQLQQPSKYRTFVIDEKGLIGIIKPEKPIDMKLLYKLSDTKRMEPRMLRSVNERAFQKFLHEAQSPNTNIMTIPVPGVSDAPGSADRIPHIASPPQKNEPIKKKD